MEHVDQVVDSDAKSSTEDVSRAKSFVKFAWSSFKKLALFAIFFLVFGTVCVIVLATIGDSGQKWIKDVFDPKANGWVFFRFLIIALMFWYWESLGKVLGFSKNPNWVDIRYQAIGLILFAEIFINLGLAAKIVEVVV